MSTTAQTLIEKIHSDFQKEIAALWGKESYYKKFLEETGMSPREALLQEQGYAPPPADGMLALTALAAEYARVGCQDIANLFNQLQDPRNYVAVFTEAQQKYQESPDYNYGAVLSHCFDNGFGTKINKKAAFKIDEQFSKQNHPIALCSLANEYFDGNIVPADHKRANELYQIAISPQQQSFYLPHAMWGLRLRDGDGIEKNKTQSLHFLNLADQQGCCLATVILTRYYLETLNQLLDGAAANPAQAEVKQAKEHVYFYAERADKLGSVLGKYFLAICYFKGWGINQDQQRYLELLNQCVTMGYAAATQSAATNYQYGLEGILVADPMQALTLHFSCLRRNALDSLEDFKALIASNINNPEFMVNAYDLCKQCLQGHLLDNALDSTVIGLFYQQGILLPKNIEIAIVCLQKGADEGLTEAATLLIKLARYPESSGLVPIALLKKYFAYANDEEIADVREHYKTSYTPLFKALKQAWPPSVVVPEGITELISDYAVSTLDEQRGTISTPPV